MGERGSRKCIPFGPLVKMAEGSRRKLLVTGVSIANSGKTGTNILGISDWEEVFETIYYCTLQEGIFA